MTEIKETVRTCLTKNKDNVRWIRSEQFNSVRIFRAMQLCHVHTLTKLVPLQFHAPTECSRVGSECAVDYSNEFITQEIINRDESFDI